MMKTFLRKYYWILIASFIVLLDQISKLIISENLDVFDEIIVIPGFFSITHIHNEGIAFGMLAQFGSISKIFVAVLTSVLIVVAFIVLARGIISHKFGVVTIAMIIGGGVGNLIDRIFLHYVVDFFSFTFFGKDFAVFNVADVFVTIGTFLFIFYFMFLEKSTEEKKDGNTEISDN